MNVKNLKRKWDLVVIGGGIAGSGIFYETVKMGLNVLLVEHQDFAWGTSSRSSKLVHGGLRYLREGHVSLTIDSVRERERLLKDAAGLVEPIGFLMPIYKERGPGKWTMEAGLSFYDLIARKRTHKYYGKNDFCKLIPQIDRKGLLGGVHFFDAQVDDARLVLRLINEAVQSGGTALNYTEAIETGRDAEGNVNGVLIKDSENNSETFLSTRAVINATGCWAEQLHPSPKPNLHIRPLRGSHIIFPSHVLPLNQAVSFMHPSDNRAVFAIPWEGAVLVGTTDLDHEDDLTREPAITQQELEYLILGVQSLFPSLDISAKGCISTISGLRPVLSQGKGTPSEESREHVVWADKGLITITGGKLTTFRKLAFDAIHAAMPFLPTNKKPDQNASLFSETPEKPANNFGLPLTTWHYLYGRYGLSAEKLVMQSTPEDLTPIPNTRTLWAELSYAAGHEYVRHLSDLLLRRVRVGILTPHGAISHMNRIKKLCRPSLSWSRKKWKQEVKIYLASWRHAHALPEERENSSANRKYPWLKVREKINTHFRRSDSG